MAGMTTPWIAAEPLDAASFVELRRRAMFDYCKWDPQIGDACVIARSPLVIRRQAWGEVVDIAEALARETLAAERELAQRPGLHRSLGLPRAVRRALRRAADLGPPPDAARLIRFDFHFTTDGWRISEANADVPGGLNEASGLPVAIAPHYAWAAPVGDPAGAYAAALTARVSEGAAVALVHATAYSEDQQMLRFVASRLEASGLRAHLASPAHVRWRDGQAELDAAWWRGPLDLLVRFFPADWLAALPAATGWPYFFGGARTSSSNPATAVLVQSKRFPLVWDDLRTPLPVWRARLPETRDPRDAPWRSSEEWIVKPVLGRVGEGVGLRDCVAPRDMRRIDRAVRLWPRSWIAQRRFTIVPLELKGGRVFPCLGVYTLDGRVVGAYGRLARVPLVDERAADAAVLGA